MGWRRERSMAIKNLAHMETWDGCLASALKVKQFKWSCSSDRESDDLFHRK